VNTPFGFALHSDDDIFSVVPLFQIPDGLGDLAQRVRPVADRCELPGFDELLEDDQLLLVATASLLRNDLPSAAWQVRIEEQ
jgi:hypothetical protein